MYAGPKVRTYMLIFLKEISIYHSKMWFFRLRRLSRFVYFQFTCSFYCGSATVVWISIYLFMFAAIYIYYKAVSRIQFLNTRSLLHKFQFTVNLRMYFWFNELRRRHFNLLWVCQKYCRFQCDPSHSQKSQFTVVSNVLPV